MSGVRTGTRLEQLRDLQRTTRIQHAYNLAHGLPTRRHRDLLDALAVEIAREDPTPYVIHRRRRSGPNIVDQLLREHGVTARGVKEWALRYGLISEVRRGRVGIELVRAYITAKENR